MNENLQMTTDLFGKTLSRLTEMVVVRLSTVAAEVLLPQRFFATSVKRSCGIHVRCGRIRALCVDGSAPL